LLQQERARELQDTIAKKEGIIENTRKEHAQRTEQLEAETAELASTEQQLAERTLQLKRESAARAAAEEEVVRLRADHDVRASEARSLEARSLEAQLEAIAAELQKLGSTCSEAQQANRRLEAELSANAARVGEAQVLAHPACPGCRPLCSAPLAHPRTIVQAMVAAVAGAQATVQQQVSHLNPRMHARTYALCKAGQSCRHG
jgi:hypothetical protein